MKKKTLYSFKTTEFKHYPKQLSWYVTTSIIFLGIAFLFIYYLHFYLAGLISVLGLIALLVHGSHEPKKIKVEITDKYIKINRKKHQYNQLKSFWTYTQGKEQKFYIQTTDLLFSIISIPLGKGDPDKIKKALSGLLPSKDDGEAINDKIVRWFRF